MALTRATIRRDSVSLLRFPFLSQVQIFSYDISLVCRLKCQYNCFSSHFCFLVIFVLYIIIIIIHSSFSHQRYLMVFHWSLSDSKFPQVSRTLLSILAILNNVVVLMVSPRPPTFTSSSPFNNPLVTVPKAPITIGIIVTFMSHSFF